MIAHVHAEAVLQPHGHGRALSPFARQRQGQESVPRRATTATGSGFRRWRYHFTRRPARARRALTAVCAPTINSYKRLVVGRCAVRRHLGTGVHRLRRQQPHSAACAFPTAGWSCACPTALQSLSRDRRDHSPRAWTACGASSIPVPPNNTDLYALSPEELQAQGIGAAAAEPCARRSTRSKPTTWCARALARSARRGILTLKRMEWVEYSRPGLGVGDASATWNSSEGVEHVRNRRTPDQEAGVAPRARRLMLPMLIGMTERGPDSAGLAVYARAAVAPDAAIQPLCGPTAHRLGRRRSGRAAGAVRRRGILRRRQPRRSSISTVHVAEAASWLARRLPGRHVLSVGQSIDLYKDVGTPADDRGRYDFANLAGTHLVGHTRMATESAVTPAHAHPFTAGRRFLPRAQRIAVQSLTASAARLELAGVEFDTDNDTEARLPLPPLADVRRATISRPRSSRVRRCSTGSTPSSSARATSSRSCAMRLPASRRSWRRPTTTSRSRRNIVRSPNCREFATRSCSSPARGNLRMAGMSLVRPRAASAARAQPLPASRRGRSGRRRSRSRIPMARTTSPSGVERGARDRDRRTCGLLRGRNESARRHRRSAAMPVPAWRKAWLRAACTSPGSRRSRPAPPRTAACWSSMAMHRCAAASR